MDELLEDANNMGKLVDLNNYVDEIEVESQRNFISACDLGLSQVFNQISIENYFSKTKLILVHDLKIQILTADVTENSSIKPFLKKTQACLTFNPEENIDKPTSSEKSPQSIVNFFSILSSPTTLPNSLYFTFFANNFFNSATGSSLDLLKLVPMPPALAQPFKP